MDKAAIAREVAEQLWKTEESIDAALADCAQLIAVSAASRRALNLSSTADDAAMAKIVETMQGLSAGRSSLVSAHAELAELQKRLGIRRTKMLGIIKLSAEPAEDEAPLQVVGGAR